MPTSSAISVYTRAWFWPMAPTPITPTRIADATRPRMSRRDINARRVSRGAKPSYRPEASAAAGVRARGCRPRVRETGQSPQRLLDDLVQGDAILLLLGDVPARLRPEAGALPRTRLGPTAQGRRLLRPQAPA